MIRVIIYLLIFLFVPISGFSAPNDEFVTNGSFEDGPGDWDSYGSPAGYPRVDGGRTGSYSRKVNLDGDGSQGGIQQLITGLTVGKTYRFVAWVKGWQLAAEDFYLFFMETTSSTEYSNDAWVRLEGTKTATATSTYVRIYVASTNAANANAAFYIDDVSVKEMWQGKWNGATIEKWNGITNPMKWNGF